MYNPQNSKKTEEKRIKEAGRSSFSENRGTMITICIFGIIVISILYISAFLSII